MKSDEALAAEQSVEAKLGDLGLDQIRRVSPAIETAPEAGTPVEVQEEVTDQPRNELGQFAAEETETVEEAAPSAEDPTGTGQDPAVAAFLAKYGGDYDKAIEGAVHLQRKSGEQSNELGELRRMVDELGQLRESIQEGQRQPAPVLDQGTVDWFDEQAAMNPHGAAEYARQQGNELLMQRALATWKEMDPYAASVYTNDLRNQQMYSQLDERITKAQQLPMDATINVALTNVRTKNPEFSNYDDSIANVMEKYPALQDALQAAANAGDNAKLEAAIETAYALAQGDTLRKAVFSGATPESTTTMSEVVAPTVSEPHEAPPPPTPVDEFQAAFKEEADRRRSGVFVAE